MKGREDYGFSLYCCHRFTAALVRSARGRRSGSASRDRVDAKGYACKWQENVVDGMPITVIADDFGSGAGRELDKKLCAAHSSAALVINTFGRWRTEPESLRIAGVSRFHNIQFEMTFPTGLGGTPPHLDLFADGDSIVAVESKCTEWMDSKLALFSDSYDRLLDCLGDSVWFGVIRELRAKPDRYLFLDAAQLVKHAFGLLKRFASREIRLVYLYWEPANEHDWPECRRHRGEAQELARMVANSTVRLIPMSYQELWEEWKLAGSPPHLPLLKKRYCRTV